MNQPATPPDASIATLVNKVETFLGVKFSATNDNRQFLKYINELTLADRQGCDTSELKSSDINWLKSAMDNDIERGIDQTIKRLFVLQLLLSATNISDETAAEEKGPYNIVTRDRLKRKLSTIQALPESMGELNVNDAFEAIQGVIDNLRVISGAKEEMVESVQSIDEDFATTSPSMFVPLAQYASEESATKKDTKKKRLNEVASKHSSTAKQLNTFVEIA